MLVSLMDRKYDGHLWEKVVKDKLLGWRVNEDEDEEESLVDLWLRKALIPIVRVENNLV